MNHQAEEALRLELGSLISQSLHLQHQITHTFNQLQNIYSNHPATTAILTQELLSLRDQLKRFHSQLRTSGLGALPTSTTTNPNPEASYQIDTLLLQLQNHFQSLYQQRQNQREAAGIVIGLILPSASSTADT